MRLSELWIGDEVYMRLSDRVGRFVGIAKDGRARIEHDGKIYLIHPKHLSLQENKSRNYKLENIMREEAKANLKKGTLPNTIDLHIEQLAPNLKNEAPQLILSYQIKKCKAYIDSAIALKYKYILIIHGKGAGVLKMEILHLIESYEQIAYVIPKHEGGASEVWFNI